MEVFPASLFCNNQQFTSHSPDTKTDHFIVEDLLDFPTDDNMVIEDGGAFVADTSTDSSTAVDSCNSSSLCGGGEYTLPGDDFVDNHFSNLCTPYDDLAEFEWLSNFVEESFSNEDVQKSQLLSGVKTRPEDTPKMYPFQPPVINRANNSLLNHDMTVPGKARTKRSRVTSCNWALRVPATPPSIMEPASNMSSSSKPDIVSNSIEKKKMRTPKKEMDHDDYRYSKNEEGRKCLHCATEKTPQWRTGPMGPRTLCNACGVRYKSGRLVPEYRPATSPTFVLTKHSNSHRKVLEIRRQKMQKSLENQPQIINHRDVMLQMPNVDNYLIHHP